MNQKASKNIINLSEKHNAGQSGFSIVYAVVVIFIFSLVLLTALQYATNELRLVKATANREQAFQIAEAGINYYEWHLAHFTQDFWDGNATSTTGPYVHNYLDEDSQTVIGQYKLAITQPLLGSTITTIQSTGYTLANPSTVRSVTVRYGIPSLAKYSFLTNSDVWIGSAEHVSGQMHANGGIRFDGTANAPVSSAKTTYTCQSWSGLPCPSLKAGIWGSAPAATQAFWSISQPNFDFSTLTTNLAGAKAIAQGDGAPAYLSPSNKFGYDLKFGSNGKVDIYLIKKLLAPPAQAWDISGNPVSTSIDYDPSQLQLLYSQAVLPAHGVFYIEDNVWVEGNLKGRVLVVAAKLPFNAGTAPSIYIPNNICYTQCGAGRDSTSALGLLAQQNIVPTFGAPTNLEIDAAMIAQNGSIQVYEYADFANVKNSITVFGTLCTFGQWTWTYVNGSNTAVSGYTSTFTNYDSNLLFAPPPSFPLSASGYQQLNWVSN